MGPRNFDNQPLPADLYTFQRYDAQLRKIIWNSGMEMSSKVQDLQGREIVIGLFTYKPFMLLDYVCMYIFNILHALYCFQIKRKNNQMPLIAR